LIAPRARGHHTDDSVTGLGRTTVLQAQGRRGSMMSRAWEQHRVHSVMCSRRKTLLWARKRRCGPGDGAHVVNGVTDLDRGRWRHVKGLDRGRERQCRGSREDSMMACRLWGGRRWCAMVYLQENHCSNRHR
jgi:hypothetical protein